MTEFHECGGCAPPVVTEDPYTHLRSAYDAGLTIMARKDDGTFHRTMPPKFTCPADRYIAVGIGGVMNHNGTQVSL